MAKLVRVPTFAHKNHTVRPGASKRLLIRARFDHPIAEPPAIRYSAADDSIVKLRQRHSLELVDGTTHYEGPIAVEGKKLNGKTVLSRDRGQDRGCTMTVAQREDEGIELTFELVDYSLGQNYRATASVSPRLVPGRAAACVLSHVISSAGTGREGTS